MVEIHNVDLPAPNFFKCLGTADKPVFIRGIVGDEPTYRTTTLTIDCDYLIFENIKFDLGSETRNIFKIGSEGNGVTNISIRNCEFFGDDGFDLSGVGNIPVILVRNTTNSNEVTNIVVYNNYFYDIANGRSGGSQDAVCISADAYSNNIWIVDNTIHHIGGDGVQISHDY